MWPSCSSVTFSSRVSPLCRWLLSAAVRWGWADPAVLAPAGTPPAEDRRFNIHFFFFTPWDFCWVEHFFFSSPTTVSYLCDGEGLLLGVLTEADHKQYLRGEEQTASMLLTWPTHDGHLQGHVELRPPQRLEHLPVVIEESKQERMYVINMLSQTQYAIYLEGRVCMQSLNFPFKSFYA